MPEMTQNKCLGKRAPRIDPRTLRFADYAAKLSPPPAQAGYVSDVVSWPMFMNDSIGDCTIAAAAHMIEQWTAYANPPAVIATDSEVVSAYSAVSGYVPGDPSTDNGAVILDVLKYWKSTGVAGHKIAAYVAVSGETEMKQAVQLFGNCYIGVQLPITAQTPSVGNNGLPAWASPSGELTGNAAPGSWGGHAIPIVKYGKKGNVGTEVVTWGQLYDVSWHWLDAYMDEAWAVLTTDWISSNGESPSGFDLAQLQADLSEIK